MSMTGEFPELLLIKPLPAIGLEAGLPTEGLGREKASRTDLYCQGDKKVRVLNRGLSSSGVRERVWVYLAH